MHIPATLADIHARIAQLRDTRPPDEHAAFTQILADICTFASTHPDTHHPVLTVQLPGRLSPTTLWYRGNPHVFDAPRTAILGHAQIGDLVIDEARYLAATLAVAGHTLVVPLGSVFASAIHHELYSVDGAAIAVLNGGIDTADDVLSGYEKHVLREHGLILAGMRPGTPENAAHYRRERYYSVVLANRLIIMTANRLSDAEHAFRLGIPIYFWSPTLADNPDVCAFMANAANDTAFWLSSEDLPAFAADGCKSRQSSPDTHP